MDAGSPPQKIVRRIRTLIAHGDADRRCLRDEAAGERRAALLLGDVINLMMKKRTQIAHKNRLLCPCCPSCPSRYL